MSDTGVRREARGARAGIWLAVILVEFTSIGQGLSPSRRFDDGQTVLLVVLSLASGALFLLIERGVAGHAARRPMVGYTLALGVCVLVSYAVSDSWANVGLAVAAALVVFGWGRGWWVIPIIAVWVGTGTVRDAPADPSVWLTSVGIWATIVVVGIVLYLFMRLVMVLSELERTREELARRQVDDERNRIARDLHDVLGRTLVALSLRAEVVERLIERDPAGAHHQLGEMRSTISQGQVRLRSLTSGPTIVGIAEELNAAAALFERLSIDADIDRTEVSDPAVGQVLAAVVRESVTNLLKHSRPRTVRIGLRVESLDTVLTIVNDGQIPPREGAHPGTGLADLTRRVAVLGGELSAAPVDGSLFGVLARIPTGPTGALDARMPVDATTSTLEEIQ